MMLRKKGAGKFGNTLYRLDIYFHEIDLLSSQSSSTNCSWQEESAFRLCLLFLPSTLHENIHLSDHAPPVL